MRAFVLLKWALVFALPLALLPLGSLASGMAPSSLETAVVKIRSTSSTVGLAMAASGIAFQRGGKAYLLTSEHAVIHEDESVSAPRIVRFRMPVEFATDITPEEIAEIRRKLALQFISITVENSGAVEMHDGVAYLSYIAYERNPSPPAKVTTEVLFPDGVRGSASYLVSDWGRGLALLELKGVTAAKAASLPTWEDLRQLEGTSRTGASVMLGGYPAQSARLSLTPGEIDNARFAYPVLAQIDALLSVEGSFAEFGMSGGAVWDQDGHFTGILSHLTRIGAGGQPEVWSPEFPMDELRVLVIPLSEVVSWVEGYFTAPNASLSLYENFVTQAQPGFDLIHSRGATFRYFCDQPKDCLVSIDLLTTPTRATQLFDDAVGTVARILERLSFYRAGGVLEPLDRSVHSASVRGFRKKIGSLSELGNAARIEVDSPGTFFRALKNPGFDLVAEFRFGFADTGPFFNMRDAVEKVRDLAKQPAERCSDLVTTLGRKPDYVTVRSFCESVEDVYQALDRESDRLSDINERGYRGDLLPVDLGLFFSPADLKMVEGWAAIDRNSTTLGPYLRKRLEKIRAALGYIVYDPAADYRQLDAQPPF